jgi:hypothetical protein
MNIGAVGPILVLAVATPEDVDVLAVIGSGQVGRADNRLPVAVLEAGLGGGGVGLRHQ